MDDGLIWNCDVDGDVLYYYDDDDDYDYDDDFDLVVDDSYFGWGVSEDIVLRMEIDV